MKVIFLDFDGPMISHRARSLPLIWGGDLADLPEPFDATENRKFNRETRVPKFDPVAVSLVGKLVLGHDAQLVVTSSWRKLGRRNVEHILDINGLSSTWLHASWCTEPEGKGATRSDEIYQWLNRVQHAGGEIESYAVFDDDPSILSLPGGVLVPYADGIRWADFCSASAALGKGFRISDFTMLDGDLIADVAVGNLGEIPVDRFGHTLHKYNFGPIEMSKGAAPNGCVRCTHSPYQILRVLRAEGEQQGVFQWSR